MTFGCKRAMIHTMVDGTFRQTNLTNESREYLAKREELRLAEIELMLQCERVAELRRQEGPRDLNAGDEPARTVRFSEQRRTDAVPANPLIGIMWRREPFAYIP